MSIINIKSKYYNKYVVGIKFYAYFFSWFVFALAVLMIINMIMFWYDSYTVPFVTYIFYALLALIGALFSTLCNKASYILNIVLLLINCIVSLYIYPLVTTRYPLTAITDFLLGTKNESFSNYFLKAIESISHDIVFFVSIVLLIAFILQKDFFFKEITDLKMKNISYMNQE